MTLKKLMFSLNGADVIQKENVKVIKKKLLNLTLKIKLI